MSLGNFLKEISYELYEKYVFEKYKDEKGEKKLETYDFDFKPKFDHHSYSSLDLNYPSIDELPDNHYAREYIAKRKIPLQFWGDLYFVPDFKELVDKTEPENEYGLKQGDPRIVIPFRDKEKRIIAFQGRSFSDRGLRYITIKVYPDAPKIYGLDRVDPENRVYVVEGPFDSLFIPNSIATAGSNFGSDNIPAYDNMVYIFDNEPRNKTIIQTMKKLSDEGKEICVWPDVTEEKDINDMALAGRTSKEIIRIINTNSYKGLSARLAIDEWKRC
jgi:hypothetical protein